MNTRALIYELLDFVDPVLDHLGSRHRVAFVHKILENGTGADRQLAAFEQDRNLASRKRPRPVPAITSQPSDCRVWPKPVFMLCRATGAGNQRQSATITLAISRLKNAGTRKRLLRTTIAAMPRTRASIVCISCKGKNSLKTRQGFRELCRPKTAIVYNSPPRPGCDPVQKQPTADREPLCSVYRWHWPVVCTLCTASYRPIRVQLQLPAQWVPTLVSLRPLACWWLSLPSCLRFFATYLHL